MNFVGVESANTATIWSSDWISRYVYTQNGPPPATQCMEETPL
jgi:hypothetical protein